MTTAGAGGELESGSPGLGLRMELVHWDRKGGKSLAERQKGWRDVLQKSRTVRSRFLI